MNHPEREEWVPFVFGEAEPENHRRLQQHLQTCSECRGRLELWRSTLHRLDAWRLPSPAPRHKVFAPLLKWAAAAVVMVGVGFGVGRSMASTANLGRIRAAIEPELRQQLRQEFTLALRQELDKAASTTLATANEQARRLVEESNSTLESRHAEDNQAIFAGLVSLKKDVDTLAVTTAASLRRAEQQLVQLADYPEPEPTTDSTQK
jgi:hypothetical protein